ncbi:hypothetical protein BJV74DRAFT_799817 [Russula compacta]|nr:hypothetical protein BJV74DRAFT_799817 [Russula compacta]
MEAHGGGAWGGDKEMNEGTAVEKRSTRPKGGAEQSRGTVGVPLWTGHNGTLESGLGKDRATEYDDDRIAMITGTGAVATPTTRRCATGTGTTVPTPAWDRFRVDGEEGNQLGIPNFPPTKRGEERGNDRDSEEDTKCVRTVSQEIRQGGVEIYHSRVGRDKSKDER